MTKTLGRDDLARENEILRCRLEEAEDALRAIGSGEVDAVFVDADEQQVYTLETAQNPYRLLVAQVPQAALTLTAKGSIISCNSRFAALVERSPSSLYGRPLADLVAEESRETLEAMLSQGCTVEVQDTLILLRADGSPKPTFLGVRPLREGALGLCLLVTDLTEQRHYEELQRTQRALRESEARLESDLAAAERLQDISSRLIQQGDVSRLYGQILDAAIAITHADCATMQMLDPAGSSLRLLAHRGLEDELANAFALVSVDASTTCGAASRAGERVVAPDLETFEGIAGTPAGDAHLAAGIRAAQSTPLLSRSGEVLGMISTHWRSRHEPADRDLRLLDVLARQAADLIERSLGEQALRDADRRKDEFLATLAHELRNPLAPIRNAVQILKVKGPPVPELQWARDVIDRQVQLMSRLLDDLLDVSRIAHDRPELRRELVELSSVLEAAVETSRPLIEAGEHELTVTLPREPVRLEGDPVRLAQVFGNLLNNAAKYTEPGGSIRVTVECVGSEVVVSVKDTGIGITGELLPHVFELFSRARTALSQAQGGFGIGLSLVRGLVELHGGSVEARSEGAGKGSEFLVRLPVVEASARDASRSPARAERPAAAGRRLLIVDDSHDSADSLAMLLRAAGHEVQTAYDGERAIETARAMRPQVILLDIGMPGIDGLETCRRIREQPWGRSIFLVALTGWGQDEDRRRSEEAGFDQHLVKPVDWIEVTDLLGSLERKRRGERVRR